MKPLHGVLDSASDGLQFLLGITEPNDGIFHSACAVPHRKHFPISLFVTNSSQILLTKLFEVPALNGFFITLYPVAFQDRYNFIGAQLLMLQKPFEHLPFRFLWNLPHVHTSNLRE